MKNWQAWMACGLLMSLSGAAQADIFRWDNGQLIPGTQGITPGPATQLGARVLQFAELSNTNLTGSSFYDNRMLHGSDLTGARFTNANLSYAVLTKSNLTGADFAGARVIGTYLWGTQGFTKEQLYSTASYQAKNLHEIQIGFLDLSGWELSGQDLTGAQLSHSTLTDTNLAGAYLRNAYLDGATLTNTDLSGTNLTNAVLAEATLTNANLAGAVVAGANFESGRGYWYGPGGGIALPQLYSTASYQQRNLNGINLYGNNMTGGDFSGQDLAGANFYSSTLTNANLAGAMVTGASFGNTTSRGFTKEHLYSTASYQQKGLRGSGLNDNDLTEWDFSGQNLTGAVFSSSTLTSANLAGASLTSANFSFSTLTSANFAGANLTSANLGRSTLTNANFAGAVVTGAKFDRVDSFFGISGSGITLPQLYSTASYQQKNLRGIGLVGSDLTGGDFSGQDLSGASLDGSTLTNVNLSGTNLTNARLGGRCDYFECSAFGAILTNANLAGAVVAGADFSGAGGSGITLQQLYSTASYHQRNLRGIGLRNHELTGGDFSGQDLAGADFGGSTLTNANFSFADRRGARIPSEPIQLARNTIWEFGAISGLDLAAGETLVVRDSEIGITVYDSMNVVSGGTLELMLGDADWGSTMLVAAGVTPDLGCTFRVRFADLANLASMLGTTFDFFNWPAVLDTNNRFDAIELPPGTQWDLNQLYVTGTAQLTAIPEPSAVLLFACGTAAWILGWAFRQRRHVRHVSSEVSHHCTIDSVKSERKVHLNSFYPTARVLR